MIEYSKKLILLEVFQLKYGYVEAYECDHR